MQERNAGILARSLEERGVAVERIEVVGDDLDGIASALGRLIDGGADLVCVSGGLGPTHDDLTMQAVAQATGRALAVDPEALAMVRARSAGILVDDLVHRALQEKQASLPEGSVLLPPAGTAPGCVLRHGATTVVVLPGPPWELATMWEGALRESLVEEVVARAPGVGERVLRVFAVPESHLIASIAGIDPDAWSRVSVGICARDGELEVTVRSAAGDEWAADALEAMIAEGVGDALYSRDGATLDDVVARRLVTARETVAVAESCTGGGLGARLTGPPGSSAYVLGGVIAYADAAKVALLGVDPEVIRRHGAVSAECAEQMALGVRRALGSDWALSITGVAGPGGGSADKPVGLVHIGLAGPDGVRQAVQNRAGDRETIRTRATAGALHLLRRALVERAPV